MSEASRGPKVDSRLEQVERVTISFETFKKALRRNYLGESSRRDRSYVLRLYPPFEGEMEAEYYESEQGVHYDNNWDEKPVHIAPEMLILEGSESGFNSIINPPEEWQVRQNLTDEEIEEAGGIDAAMEESWEMFWAELKTILPETFDLGLTQSMTGSYAVELEWEA
jgi:hypothetical protein